MNWVDIIQCITTTCLLCGLSVPTFVKVTHKVLEVCVHSPRSGVDCSHGNKSCLTPVSVRNTAGPPCVALVRSRGPICTLSEACTLRVVTRHLSARML